MATAADVAKPAQPVPYDWTGCYVGGNVGYSTVNAMSTVNTNATAVGPITVPAAIGPIATQVKVLGFNIPINLGQISTPVSVGPIKVGALQGQGAGSNSGAIIGGQFGCNFVQTPNQGDFGSLVYGIEGDFELAVPPNQVGSMITTAALLDFGMPAAALIKGRIGFTPLDRLLVYAVAGGGAAAVAVAPTTVNGNLTVVTQTDVKFAPVVAVGIGIEAALSRHWTTKAEFLYIYGFPVTSNFNFLGAPAAAKVTVQNSIFHVGLNYRF